MYHHKGIKVIRSIAINKKISDHDIKIGNAKVKLQINERFTNLEINDKNKIKANEESLMNSIYSNKINLINTKKIISVDNYSLNPQNLEE